MTLNYALPALIHIPLILPSEFKAHQERLVAACNTLKACTHLLTNLGVESGSLDSVSSSLEAARQLLSFFPAPPSCSYAANDPLALLASLEAQFDQHKAFKNSRMAALGWQFGPSAASRVISAPPLDPEAALATGRVATAAITAILDDPQGSIAAVALGILCSAVAACDKRVEDEKKRRQYHEAQTLQVMAFSACIGFTFDNFELINGAGAERSASVHNRRRRQSSSLARSCNAS